MVDEKSVLTALWLNSVCSHEPEVIDKHIRALGSAQAVYDADDMTLREHKLGRRALDKNMSEAEAIYRECQSSGIHIITIDDEKYPGKLRHMYCPPRVLYVMGTLPDMDNLIGICMVGSREPTGNGVEVVHSIAGEIASRGGIIVSGMAVGIDRAAHTGALKAGNKTVAALAGGVDVIYPTENTDLYYKISENGAVVSERPPGYPAKGTLYRQRNRIMVGLSVATVIAEGRFNSGTSISARLATENNRDVFAIPITPLLGTAELPNSLIADGAQIVRNAQDILREYAYNFPELLENGKSLIGAPVEISAYSKNKTPKRPPRERTAEPERIEKLPVDTILTRISDEKQAAVVKYLYENGETMIDDIAENCQISVSVLNSQLLMLEMRGIVKRSAGNIYSLILK